MYIVIKFLENVAKFFRIKLKILYWKLKYGKRIKIGKNFKFRKSLIINIDSKGRLEIGDNTYFNNYCSINCHKKITIGNNNLFGENVKIYDHNHIFNNKNINMEKAFNDKEIFIGNDNWIASNVMILSNTKLGNRNVVAASTVLNEQYENEQLIKEEKVKKIEPIKYKDNFNNTIK